MLKDIKGGKMDKIDVSEIPLLCGHPSDKSIINPDDWIHHLENIRGQKTPKLPKYCILSFKYTNAAKFLQEDYKTETINFLGEECLIYVFKHKKISMCFAYLGIGAPLAGATLEELIALGVEYVIFFGGVGVLKPEIERWKIIVPIKAIRDEGTSYHYQTPSKYSVPSPILIKAVEKVLKNKDIKYVKGIVWTTDAPYRETVEKRRKFLAEGALCVDVEASAFFSIA